MILAVIIIILQLNLLILSKLIFYEDKQGWMIDTNRAIPDSCYIGQRRENDWDLLYR